MLVGLIKNEQTTDFFFCAGGGGRGRVGIKVLILQLDCIESQMMQISSRQFAGGGVVVRPFGS